MVNTQGRIAYLVAHKPDAIVTWVWLDLAHRRASPSHDGRVRARRGARGSKSEGLVDSGYRVLTVRSVVVHVALARMTLAPRVFVRDDIFRFSKIGRSRV